MVEPGVGESVISPAISFFSFSRDIFIGKIKPNTILKLTELGLAFVVRSYFVFCLYWLLAKNCAHANPSIHH
jgi:hypothetical protein